MLTAFTKDVHLRSLCSYYCPLFHDKSVRYSVETHRRCPHRSCEGEEVEKGACCLFVEDGYLGYHLATAFEWVQDKGSCLDRVALLLLLHPFPREATRIAPQSWN